MDTRNSVSPARPGTAAEYIPYRHNERCGCFILSKKVLERFSKDRDLTEAQRKSFADTAALEESWRAVRLAKANFAQMSRLLLQTAVPASIAASPPPVSVCDCRHGLSLPGVPIGNPGTSADATAQRAYAETTAVADFYRSQFGRNSLDNSGMGLLSSIHYSVNYNNAFWNGNQMTYGDGDGNIFVDFTKSNDVIAHELTHGVTQFTAGLAYFNQAGGLNESMSDVFGSMFRQWRANQTVNAADWLIGKDIMGPGAIARGYTCLRDMANPSAPHCLSPQPTNFAQYQDGMDPHESSGIPNLAFYTAAMAIGGRSWEKAGKIWYQALTQGAPTPNMQMAEFASRTRTLAGSLFPAEPAVKSAVDRAWNAVGI